VVEIVVYSTWLHVWSLMSKWKAATGAGLGVSGVGGELPWLCFVDLPAVSEPAVKDDDGIKIEEAVRRVKLHDGKAVEPGRGTIPQIIWIGGTEDRVDPSTVLLFLLDGTDLRVTLGCVCVTGEDVASVQLHGLLTGERAALVADAGKDLAVDDVELSDAFGMT
jgi:hypothetical protein